MDNQDTNILDSEDLTIAKYMEQEQRLKFLEKLLDNSKDLIYYTTMIPERKFIYLSESIESILGYTTKEFYDDLMTIATIAHPDDVEDLFKKGTLELDHSKPQLTRYRHKDGHIVWLEDSANLEYNENGEIIAVHGVCRDVSEQIQLKAKLNFLTYHDSLTELKNRMFFDTEIKKYDTEIDTSIGIIICDIDNLKIVNDNFGHRAGDILIKNVANILSTHITENMFISRIGGDEFAIIITDTNNYDVKKLCQDIHTSINKHNLMNDCLVKLSIGYAFNQTSIGQVDQLFKIADKRMYKEKSRHKDMVL